MSSFIVSQECMNNIINGLFWNQGFNERYRCTLEKGGYIRHSDFQRLGDDLFNLNARGTGQRYNDKQMLKTIYKFKWKDDSRPDEYQVIKSMECLHYQCCEGDTDKTDLYKFLGRLIDLWKHYLISRIPAYEKARWD